MVGRHRRRRWGRQERGDHRVVLGVEVGVLLRATGVVDAVLVTLRPREVDEGGRARGVREEHEGGEGEGEGASEVHGDHPMEQLAGRGWDPACAGNCWGERRGARRPWLHVSEGATSCRARPAVGAASRRALRRCAYGPGGELLYRNRTCLVVQTRWARIVLHEDFYLDTGRMADFENALSRLGVQRAEG
jgi:hypothetical protein